MVEVVYEMIGDVRRTRVAEREEVVDERCDVCLSLWESVDKEENHSLVEFRRSSGDDSTIGQEQRVTGVNI